MKAMRYVVAGATVVVLVAGVLLWTNRNTLQPFTGLPEGTELVADAEGDVAVAGSEGTPVDAVDLGHIEDLRTGPDGRLAIASLDWGVVTGSDRVVQLGVDSDPFLALTSAPGEEIVVSSGCVLYKVDGAGRRSRLQGPKVLCPAAEWAETYPEHPAVVSRFERTGPVVDLDMNSGGTLYLADTAGNGVLRLGPGGDLQRIAGSGELWGNIEDGDKAIEAAFRPEQVAAGPDGSVFVLTTATPPHSSGGVLYRIDADGTITAVGGGGSEVPSDGALPTNVDFTVASDMAADDAGNVYLGLNCCQVASGGDFTGVVRVTSGGRLEVVAEPALDEPEDYDENNDEDGRGAKPLLGGVAVHGGSLYVSMAASSNEDEYYGSVVRIPLQG